MPAARSFAGKFASTSSFSPPRNHTRLLSSGALYLASDIRTLFMKGWTVSLWLEAR